MSSVLVLNVNKKLKKEILSRRCEASFVVPHTAEVKGIDEEISSKLKKYNLNGFNYILGNQFMTFEKTKGSFYYEQECIFAEWLRALVTDLIDQKIVVSLISLFYGKEIEKDPQIMTKTMLAEELVKDDLVLEYYIIYRILKHS